MNTMLRALVLVTVILLGTTMKATAIDQVVMESKTVSPGETGATVSIQIENDIMIDAMAIPLVARSLTGGAFWSSNLDTLPGAGRLQSTLTDFRSFVTTQVDYTSPDQFILAYVRIISPCLPVGTLDALTGLTFDVNTLTGQFEIDTALYPPANTLVFIECNSTSSIAPDFTKGVISIEETAGCPIITGFGADPVLAVAGSLAGNTTLAFDPEGDPIEYYLASGPGTVNLNTGDWSYTPSCEDVFSFDVFIEATDRGEGACTIASFHVDVAPPPLSTSCSDIVVNCGDMVSQQIDASGGCPPLDYEVVSGPGTIDGSGNWEWQTSCSSPGIHTVDVSVSDAFQTETCSFDVNVVSGNAPPVIDPITDQVVAEGELLTFAVTATDTDEDPLRFFAGPLPENAAFISSTQEFFWMPNHDQEGSYDVKMFVTDGLEVDSTSFSITVDPSRYPPQIAALGTYVLREGDSLRLTLGGVTTGSLFEVEEQGDVIFPPIFGGLPPGMTYDASDSALVWNPGFTATGEYPGVSIQISDLDGGFDSTTGTIIVLPKLPIGDLDGDEVINVIDVVGAIDCVFRSNCTRALKDYDCNCDHVPNVLDVVDLIDYVFRSGSEPYECPYVTIGQPGHDKAAVGPLTLVSATDYSSAPISSIHFEYSLDQSVWQPLATDENPNEQGLGGVNADFDQFWETSSLPAGPAWLRAISEDSTHGTADTAVMEVTINKPPIPQWVHHYDPIEGILVFDGRPTVDPDGAVDSFFQWHFSNEVLDLTLHGPVVQLPVAVNDSFGVYFQAKDDEGDAATDAQCGEVTETGAETEPQTDCKCESIELITSGKLKDHCEALLTRFKENIAKDGMMQWWKDRFGSDPTDAVENLGALVGVSDQDLRNKEGVTKFRFLVHIKFIGDPKLCDFGQKAKSTAFYGAEKREKRDEAAMRDCAYDDPDFCTDDFRPPAQGGIKFWTEVAKPDVWWWDSPGLRGMYKLFFDHPARPADKKGIYYKGKFKAWASPNGGGNPDCCTRCFEINMKYDKDAKPDPDPGGEPTLSNNVSPCPAPNNTCDPTDGN